MCACVCGCRCTDNTCGVNCVTRVVTRLQIGLFVVFVSFQTTSMV